MPQRLGSITHGYPSLFGHFCDEETSLTYTDAYQDLADAFAQDMDGFGSVIVDGGRLNGVRRPF